MVLFRRQDPLTSIEKSASVNLGFGYRFLNFFCDVCGHRFEPISGWCAFLMMVHQVVANLATASFLVLGSYNLYISFSHFSMFLYFCVGFFTIVESFFRTAFIIIRKKQIVDFAMKLQFFLEHHFVRDERARLLKRLSKRLVFLIIYFMILYGIALYFNAVVINFEMNKVFSAQEAPQGVIANSTAGFSKFWAYFSQQLNLVPEEHLMTFIVAVFYFYTFLMVGRLITTDFMFFAWYWLFLEQYKVLIKVLPRALSNDKTEQGVSVKIWLQFQQDLSKYLCDVNKFLSPIIGSAVILSGFKICLLAIVCVKLAFEVNIMYMIMFGVISTQRVYIYCTIGQRIKEMINELHAAAFRCSWFKAKRRVQNAVLMICNAASERAGLTLPGTPFFALSLEFFATIMGAVFTYFIVIIQIQR